MKTFLLALLLLSPKMAFAEEAKCTVVTETEVAEEKKDINTVVPSDLKGATIIVRTADGKEKVMTAETMKVVPRKQQFIVTKTKQIERIKCEPVTITLKNRVSALAGYGPTGGLDRSESPSVVTVESKYGPVGGLQYQRLLTDRFSIGGQFQTNGTRIFSIGLDF